MRCPHAALVLLGLALRGASLLAQIPLVPAFVVNQQTRDDQRRPAICEDGAGHFVVAWQGAQDRDPAAGVVDNLYVRLFDAKAGPRTSELRVTGADGGASPRICCFADGSFVLAWLDPLTQQVLARRFSAGGAHSGAEIAVTDPGAAGPRRPPDLACTPDHSFDVVWGERATPASPAVDAVMRLRLNARNNPLGVASRVNLSPTSPDPQPRIAMDATGRAVVSWIGAGGGDLEGRLYAGDGTAASGELTLKPARVDEQIGEPAVAMTAAPEPAKSGGFSAAWYENGSFGRTDFQVFARSFAPDGTPLAAPFAVAPGELQQISPAISADDAGGFVVAWGSTGSDQKGALARAFTGDGTPAGPALLLDPAAVASGGRLGIGLTPVRGGRWVGVWDVFAGGVRGFDVAGLRVVPVCTSGGGTLCLGDRFAVRAVWRTPLGVAGTAQAMPLQPDAGYFWFFASANVEVIVKRIDGCAVGGHFWIFAGGLTDLAVDWTVVDTWTGALRAYSSPAGTPFQPIEDTNAFPCP
ncbi:MAG TPA: hypothetical protein VIH93_14255 [Thermoanaerobaculia bacterium]